MTPPLAPPIGASGVEGGAEWLTLTVAESVVYVGPAHNTVYALDAWTGQQLWAVPADSQGRFAPVVVNGMTYMTGTDDGRVYAIDAMTGQSQWTFAT